MLNIAAIAATPNAQNLCTLAICLFHFMGCGESLSDPKNVNQGFGVVKQLMRKTKNDASILEGYGLWSGHKSNGINGVFKP
jgi:hypothetical protein